MRPDETFERLAKHISPITGAVTSVRRQTVEDNGVAYSYSSGHNFALMQDSLYFLRKNLRGRSGGKGRTDHQAKVGAVCEAIERFNGIYRGDERTSTAPTPSLSDRAIHPEELLLFSDAQYAIATPGTRPRPRATTRPGPAGRERTIQWTPVWSLRDGRERLAPAGYCWYGHPDIAAHFYSASDANGCAAGNTVEEAILQGLMESSSATRWRRGGTTGRRGRRSTWRRSTSPTCRSCASIMRGLGRNLWVLDITTDLGIPPSSGARSGSTVPPKTS